MLFRKFPRHIVLTLAIAALMLSACNVGAEPSPTLDVNAINTAIVGTTVAQFSAQFTQTALAAPQATNTPQELPTFALPTDTLPALSTTDTSGALPTVSFEISPTIAGSAPLPGFTQIASPVAPVSAATQALGDECNNNVFEGDVTIPDGTILKGGEDFQKIWKIRNTGSCYWDDGYALVYIGGSTPNLDPVNFEFKKSSDFVAPGDAINIAVNLTAPCAVGKYEGHWRMRNDKGYYFGTILSVYVEVNEKCK